MVSTTLSCLIIVTPLFEQIRIGEVVVTKCIEPLGGGFFNHVPLNTERIHFFVYHLPIISIQPTENTLTFLTMDPVLIRFLSIESQNFVLFIILLSIRENL
jgi:hypothetical protein